MRKTFSGFSNLITSRPLGIDVNNAVHSMTYSPEDLVSYKATALALHMVG